MAMFKRGGIDTAAENVDSARKNKKEMLLLDQAEKRTTAQMQQDAETVRNAANNEAVAGVRSGQEKVYNSQASNIDTSSAHNRLLNIGLGMTNDFQKATQPGLIDAVNSQNSTTVTAENLSKSTAMRNALASGYDVGNDGGVGLSPGDRMPGGAARLVAAGYGDTRKNTPTVNPLWDGLKPITVGPPDTNMIASGYSRDASITGPVPVAASKTTLQKGVDTLTQKGGDFTPVAVPANPNTITARTGHRRSSAIMPGKVLDNSEWPVRKDKKLATPRQV